MRQHVNSCYNLGCKSVWSGRWGSFIGGEQGKTHFDITECVQGRLLNEEVGWDYDNPR